MKMIISIILIIAAVVSIVDLPFWHMMLTSFFFYFAVTLYNEAFDEVMGWGKKVE